MNNQVSPDAIFTIISQFLGSNEFWAMFIIFVAFGLLANLGEKLMGKVEAATKPNPPAPPTTDTSSKSPEK